MTFLDYAIVTLKIWTYGMVVCLFFSCKPMAVVIGLLILIATNTSKD